MAGESASDLCGRSTTSFPQSESEGPSVTVDDKDVMFGRGSVTMKHPGNARYRRLVQEHKDIYSRAARRRKRLIAAELIEKIKSNGSRFVKCIDDDRDHWVQVGGPEVVEKVKQALREKPKHSSWTPYFPAPDSTLSPVFPPSNILEDKTGLHAFGIGTSGLSRLFNDPIILHSYLEANGLQDRDIIHENIVRTATIAGANGATTSPYNASRSPASSLAYVFPAPESHPTPCNIMATDTAPPSMTIDRAGPTPYQQELRFIHQPAGEPAKAMVSRNGDDAHERGKSPQPEAPRAHSKNSYTIPPRREPKSSSCSDAQFDDDVFNVRQAKRMRRMATAEQEDHVFEKQETANAISSAGSGSEQPFSPLFGGKAAERLNRIETRQQKLYETVLGILE